MSINKILYYYICSKCVLLSQTIGDKSFKITRRVHHSPLSSIISRKVFFLALVLVSWQASCSSWVMKPDFYIPTVLKVHPPICRITTHATMPGRLEYSIFYLCFTILIQMNCTWKMVHTVRVWTHYLSVMSPLPLPLDYGYLPNHS